MNNKNIIFNHTLEQYKKKYRNRTYRLLKYTKKEVEDFDKLASKDLNAKNFLLKNRKWWLIKDTYYEVPKVPRFTWFRNLNAGVQTTICLLGAGVIATGASLPYILKLGQTVEPNITIQGADYDKSASHIELNKQSTIKLKEQSGKTITGIEYVKVGDKQLAADIEYSYDETTKVVTIKAVAMTSTKIEIKVTTGEPTKRYTISLDETSCAINVDEEFTLTATITENNGDEPTLFWGTSGAKANAVELTKVSNTKYKVKGKETGSCNITVGCTGGNTAVCEVTVSPAVIKVASVEITNTVTEVKVGEKIELTTKVLPENATNKELDWSMDSGGEGDAEFVEEGSKTYLKGVTGGQIGVTATAKDGSGKSNTKSFTVTEDVITKAQFVAKANEWVTGENGFINSRLEYKSSQVKYAINGIEYKIIGITYGLDDDGKRCATLSFDDETIREAIIGGYVFSGTSLDNNFGLKEETVEGVTYTIGDDEISYEDQNATGEEFKKISLNKYGYVTELDDDVVFKDIKVEYIGEPEIYYNIDWATTQFTDTTAGFNNETVYEKAKTATQIKFEKDSTTTGGVFVGEDSSGTREPVYASFTSAGNVKTLKIWSTGKISFTDNDLYNNKGFFEDCNLVTSFNFSNLDVSKAYSFKNCFKNCNSVEKLNLTYFDTFSANNMAYMFASDNPNESSLTEIEFGSLFNTSKVTNMCNMFYNCDKLISLDLSIFNTSNVNQMIYMFNGCSELSKIIVSDSFNISSVGPRKSTDMFFRCINLIGGKGTAYDENNPTDKTYARIDEGPDSDNPGYFTDAKENLQVMMV